MTISSCLQSWAIAILAVAVMLGGYSIVQMYRENLEVRAEIASMKARGCPAKVQGKLFAGSNYREIDLMRPKFSTLSCYYRVGVLS